MDAIKNAFSDAAETVNQKTTGQSSGGPTGAHPGPDAFTAHSQREEGKTVGIQDEMSQAPITLQQEGHYGFETYKAAGKLEGKKAIVTGGDSGIGRAAAVMYAMEGADVAIVYLPEEQVDATETGRLIEKYGRQAILIPQDIRDEEGCKQLVKTVVDKWGRIDILVNNASVMYDTKSITDITTEQFDRTLKTNLYGTFWITRSAVPHMPKGSSIIVTSSQVAYAGPPTLLDYSITKGGQIALVRSLSNQLLEKGIRVNAVCPGPVWTPLQEAAMDTETLKGWHKSPAPIGRIGQPSELGPAYVFLASADGSFISGQSIHVNGGAIVSS